jgi:soluble lytic murein transglycosylase-like protein
MAGCQSVATRSEPISIQSMIVKEATLQGVPTHIALGLAETESTFKPNAISKGNYGIMQIRLGTARGLGFKGSVKALMAPETNIKYGMLYLNECYAKYHNIPLMIGCYNGHASLKNPYVKKVLKNAKKYN